MLNKIKMNFINLINIIKMGLYESDDGYFMTSTLDFPPTTMLTSKGEKASKAATIIQNWWKKMMLKRVYTELEDKLYVDKTCLSECDTDIEYKSNIYFSTKDLNLNDNDNEPSSQN
jgi:hypothetical protein